MSTERWGAGFDPSLADLQGHGRRVAFYASRIAERLGLARGARERLRTAALLHDAGKAGLPPELLLRPGPLAPFEWTLVERHPLIGEQIAARLGMPHEVSAALRHHHERWSGGGYPDGLAGEAIPLFARVIAVADAFDAMTSDRPYRRALPREAATAELRRCAASHFDPELAEQMLRCVADGLCEPDPQRPGFGAHPAAPPATRRLGT